MKNSAVEGQGYVKENENKHAGNGLKARAVPAAVITGGYFY